MTRRTAPVGRRQTDLKETNPKEAFGEAKMPLGLAPDTAITELNLAFLEGALKYGQYNWRIAGVKASTYNRAMERHRKKWWNGQDRDPSTRVRELASVMACCAILIDAEFCGKLTDDRPPRADMERVLREAADVAAHLKQLFKDHNPPQYTHLGHEVANAGVPGLLVSDVPAGTIVKVLKSAREVRAFFGDGRTTKAKAVNIGTGIPPRRISRKERLARSKI